MLIIRKEQMSVFETQFSRRFRDGLLEHVRTEFAESVKNLADPALQRLLDDAITRSLTYGVTAERDVALFADLLFLLGHQFDREARLGWARKILLDSSLDGEAKMKAIYSRLAAMENRKPLPETEN